MKNIKSYFYNLKTILGIIRLWLLEGKSFHRYLIELRKDGFYKDVKHDKLNNNIAVILHAWYFTPTPFFLMMVGIFLSKKDNNIDFIIDDLDFGKSKLLFRIQINTIKFISKLISSNYKVIYISQLSPVFENVALSDAYIKDLATQNTVHYMKGELKSEGREKYFNKVYSQLYNVRPYVYSLLEKGKYNSIYLGGGICGTTGIYLKYGECLNIKTATIDSGYGVLVSSVNGAAAHVNDIPVALNLFYKNADLLNKKENIKKYVDAQISARRNGVDAFSSQVKNTDDQVNLNKEVGVLILLNSSWDSAALGINNIFDSYVGWLMETVDFLINNTSQVITIRQHPCERFEAGKSNDDFKVHIANKYGHPPRINFVDCYSEINTYNLIEKCKLVICFSSTSGIEAAIFGKTTIIASNCYYSDQDFVYKPVTIAEYHSLILDGIAGEIVINNKQKELAMICYYLGQCCNWLFTDFTPMPSDFEKWVKIPAVKLFNSDIVNIYLESITKSIPFSFLKLQKELSQSV